MMPSAMANQGDTDNLPECGLLTLGKQRPEKS